MRMLDACALIFVVNLQTQIEGGVLFPEEFESEEYLWREQLYKSGGGDLLIPVAKYH